MKIQLIDDWHRAHKFASVQIASGSALVFAVGPEVLKAGTSLLNTWMSIPDDLKNALPHGTAQMVAVSAFVLVLLGRVLRTSDGGQRDG